MIKLIPGGNLIYSQQQPIDLKKHLTNARIHPKDSDFEIKYCGDSRCSVYGQDMKYLETGKMKTFKEGRTMNVSANVTCKTKDFLYYVTCPGYHKMYIGQTGNILCEIFVFIYIPAYLQDFQQIYVVYVVIVQRDQSLTQSRQCEI